MKTRNEYRKVKRAERCGLTVKGKAITRWPVVVTCSGLSKGVPWAHSVCVDVIAATSADAADLVREEYRHYLERPFEIDVIGSRGGLACYRFVSWEGLVRLEFMSNLRARAEQKGLL
jgi:hypothetical protein